MKHQDISRSSWQGEGCSHSLFFLMFAIPITAEPRYFAPPTTSKSADTGLDKEWGGLNECGVLECRMSHTAGAVASVVLGPWSPQSFAMQCVGSMGFDQAWFYSTELRKGRRRFCRKLKQHGRTSQRCFSTRRCAWSWWWRRPRRTFAMKNSYRLSTDWT